MEALAAANANFSLELFKKITEITKAKNTGNVFYSPLSISSALAMVSLGAKGNTEVQMHEVSSQCTQFIEGDVHVAFNKLFAELNKEGAPYALSLANRLYGEKTYKFVEKFLADTKTLYLAESEEVDFISNAEAARVKINKWVEKKTQEKIKDLLAKGDVDNSTRLVLVNALYFKGDWEMKFNRGNTTEVQFKINKNESKPVQMMHQTATFPFTYVPDVDCQILELPYEGKDMSMLIMLPNNMEDNTTGLEKLEQMLTYDKLVEWTRPDMMHTVEVKVGLPRFKLEETYDLEEILVSMGMVDAFSPQKCDFSGMSPCNNLVLSKVVQKSFVEVTEEGTEAGAATAVTATLTSMPLIQKMFMADHPFLFFIRHNPTQSILFYGRYSSP
ncbi:leukocyte elastase inhibitor-like [Clupea harengus]|uniref:Leukocyte elastase inhibitor n=1 Tax=Clupea harengus TaxID=7950 RepID=A0A8M1KDL7_CLUHA|nr:leukocyte elastase inhibitor-like [Clupea harengus]